MDPGTILRVIELCFVYEVSRQSTTGAKIVDICNTWKYAEDEVQERTLILESCWTRSRYQMKIVQRMAMTMDYELRRLTDMLLQHLASKLSAAYNSLQSVMKKELEPRTGFMGFSSGVKKATYVYRKSALDDIIEDLETWQRRFDPTWYLSIKAATPIIDEELAKARKMERGTIGSSKFTTTSALSTARGLRNALSPEFGRRISIFLPTGQMETMDIPYSIAKAARPSTGHSTGNSTWYIVDSVICRPGSDMKAFSKDVRDLATRLSQVDPLVFGLLSCKGVMYSDTNQPEPEFSFVLRIPQGMEALQSLRQLLLSSDQNISLSQKFRMARELARSISSVHTFNFVHKNIRPESVLCFENVESSQSRAFLVGFDCFRSADGGTNLLGDMDWDKNVYRHPLRQGNHPAESYRIQHDIYSLGVCLLELGIWDSFVMYTPDKARQPCASRVYSDFTTWLQRKRELESPGFTAHNNFLNAVAFRLKDYLVDLAEERLPHRMGDLYTKIVLTCLTCLDGNDDSFEDSLEVRLAEDIPVAVEFLEKRTKLKLAPCNHLLAKSLSLTLYSTRKTRSEPLNMFWFLYLSDELKLLILECVGSESRDDIRNLSSTCRKLRDFLAPTVLENIRLRNSEKSGESLQAIANGLWVECVRHLVYLGIATVPSEDNLDLFPDSVNDALSNLGRFRNLEELMIEFKVNRRYSNDALEDLDNEQDPHTEECEALRVLLERSYDALGRNMGAKPIKSLYLRNIIAHEVWAWMEKPFRSFLGTLEHFTLTLRGYDGLPPGGHAFVNSLENYFFEHLTNVTEFRFSAIEKMPASGPDSHLFLNLTFFTPLPLNPDNMPLLRILKLGHIAINSTVANFIRSHRNTLEEVHLEHCWSDPMAYHRFPWGVFFGDINKGDYPRLTEFSVLPKQTDLPDDFRMLAERLEQSPERRLFAYAYVNLHSYLERDYEADLKAFDRGEDQREFDKLIAITARNDGGLC
ncbi:hypothetical protein K505DRAFT_419250 [Melanomma pulvis-pyrius CBS 109.77]|uniref:Protein kinase domain-containing protein n=1 Tax=Melanomma pulvis-pyrius CBS 109.77 TaxID=1314802 RepID=A0A6A6X5S3_9PLEO|nr:hypothetical protein K505DRAFT_419250 [Melanomma pulvis-pyrius CBS 109.77]